MSKQVLADERRICNICKFMHLLNHTLVEARMDTLLISPGPQLKLQSVQPPSPILLSSAKKPYPKVILVS